VAARLIDEDEALRIEVFASSMNLRRSAWMRGSDCSTATSVFLFA
jgi:hypothetical protein